MQVRAMSGTAGYRHSRFVFASICLATLAGFGWSGFFKAAATGHDAARSGDIEQGRYIVHHVAMCVECHTPRDADGNLERERLLRGAPVPVEAPFPQQPWAARAPRIAGLPGWTDEEIHRLLQTGKRVTGQGPRLPMPPFRLNEKDTADVVAYLRSLD